MIEYFSQLVSLIIKTIGLRECDSERVLNDRGG